MEFCLTSDIILEIIMTGSKKGNKNDADTQKKGEIANSNLTKTVVDTPPPPPLLNLEATIWGSNAQINNQTSNLMGQACDLLYGAPNHTSYNETCAPPGVLQMPQPQHHAFLQQNLSQPPQVPPPFVQNGYYNQFDSSRMFVGNQHRSPVLNNTAHNTPMNNNGKMNNNGLNEQISSDAPQWVNALMGTIDSRLKNIETQIQGQNQKWCSIETQLQSQNNRMLGIEHQISQMNELKQSVSSVQLQVSNVDTSIKNVQTQMHEYDASINHFNDLCDGIMQENSSKSTLLEELDKRVSKLEDDNVEIKDKHEKLEEKLTEVQWRSMRENLIFTGISEAEKGDTENTLRRFLADEMTIHQDIPFDRVHRLGKFDSTRSYPRPIIAKFERFRDRERVRLAAPAALQGKDYGVREQFPPEIENKRRVLYPIMKRYKQNQDNKVILVRDKLFINGEQYIPPISDDSGSSRTDQKRYKPSYRRERERDYGYVHSRTFTRRSDSHTGYIRGSRVPNESSAPRWQDSAAINFETPNRFRHLANMNSDNGLLSQGSNGKRKATSPLQDETSLKKPSSDLPPETQHDKFYSEMTITIGSPREEPMEANLIDLSSKCDGSAVDKTQTPVSPNNQNTGTFTTGQSVSRDNSPDSRNSVNEASQ